MDGLYHTMNQLSLDDLADLGLGTGLHHPQYYNKERDTKRAQIGFEQNKYIRSVNWTSIQYSCQLQELESRPCSEKDIAQDCAWFIQSYSEYRQQGKGWDSVCEWLENSVDNSLDSQSLEKSVDMAQIIHVTGWSDGHQKENDMETLLSGIHQKENGIGMETFSSVIKGCSQDEKAAWNAGHQKEADIETEAWSSGLSDISGSSAATRDEDNDIIEMVSILERATRAGGLAGQQKENDMETLELVAWQSEYRGPCNNNIDHGTDSNKSGSDNDNLETSKPFALSGTPENETVQENESTKLRKTIKELQKADIFVLSKEEINNLHTMCLDDFDSLLERNKLTPEQKEKCKDIRRRGKNSISALKCRKRKVTEIEEIGEILEEKLEKRRALKAEYEELLKRKLESEKNLNMVKTKILKLNNCSPHHYTIEVMDNDGVKMAKIIRK